MGPSIWMRFYLRTGCRVIALKVLKRLDFPVPVTSKKASYTAKICRVTLAQTTTGCAMQATSRYAPG